MQKLLKNAYIYTNGIAIAKVDSDDYYDQVLIAQSADTLLTMTGIIASFVIAKRGENFIGISGRSLGEVKCAANYGKLRWWRAFKRMQPHK